MTSSDTPFLSALAPLLLQVRAEFASAYPLSYADLESTARSNFLGDLHAIADCALAAATSDPSTLRQQILWFVRMLRSRGMAVEVIQSILKSLEQKLKAHFAIAPFPAIAWDAERLHIPNAETLQMTDWLLAGDLDAARHTFLHQLRPSFPDSLPQTSVKVIQPALYAVGDRWERNEITFEQEHIATAISQQVLSDGFTQVQMAPLQAKSALFACVPGNRHEVGLRMVADAFAIAGWKVICLPIGQSETDILQAIAQWNPDWLGLSITMPNQVEPARELVQHIRQRFSKERPMILVGGLAISEDISIRNRLGADRYCADAIEAHALAKE